MIAKILLVIMLVPALVSCAALPSNYAPPLAGNVVAIQPGSVMYGIRAALAGQPGTTILADGTRYLFVWSYNGQAAAGFWGIDTAGKAFDTAAALKGNLANAKTVAGLVDALKASGWQTVAPGAVPAVLAEFAGTRVIAAPVMLFAVGVFPGGFDQWFEDTFYPVEVDA